MLFARRPFLSGGRYSLMQINKRARLSRYYTGPDDRTVRGPEIIMNRRKGRLGKSAIH